LKSFQPLSAQESPHENSKYESSHHKKTRHTSNESNTQEEEEEDKEEALNSRIERARERAFRVDVNFVAFADVSRAVSRDECGALRGKRFVFIR